MTNFDENRYGEYLAQFFELTDLYRPKFDIYVPSPVYYRPFTHNPRMPSEHYIPQMQQKQSLLKPTSIDAADSLPSRSEISNLIVQKLCPTSNDDVSDEDLSGDEKDHDDNPYFAITNSRAVDNRPPSWLSSVLFNGRIKADELPENCPRPQRDDCSLLPELKDVIAKLVESDGSLRDSDEKLTMKFPGGTSEAFYTPNHGYISKNGLSWFRKKPEKSMVESAIPLNTIKVVVPQKRFSNQSLVIVGGKRIYTDSSNECIAYAHSGKCIANSLCNFDHDGRSDHRSTKLCRDLLFGACRNGSNCSKGSHSLDEHQLPICHYFLRMTCISDACPYLHIKYNDSLEYCPAFQKGTCILGTRCPKPHRYNPRILDTKCNSGLANMRSAENNGLVDNVEESSQQSTGRSENNELPTWNF